MSKYTTEVRFICENYNGLDESKGYIDTATIISNARTKIFDFAYPIFDESYRNVLETKIIRHFYTREIGAETVGLWKFWLNTKMNEIMPYYNKLYRSELLEFNPLYTHNLTRTHDRTEEGEVASTGEMTTHNEATGTSEGTTETTVKDRYSDTPQGSITNLENDTYLTNAEITDTKVESEGTTENTADGTVNTSDNREHNTTEHYLETVVGYEGKDASELLLKYRQTFLNIDMMIINDLEELFIQLW